MTTPPTDGIPDAVWNHLFPGTSPFVWSPLPAAARDALSAGD